MPPVGGFGAQKGETWPRHDLHTRKRAIRHQQLVAQRPQRDFVPLPEASAFMNCAPAIARLTAGRSYIRVRNAIVYQSLAGIYAHR